MGCCHDKDNFQEVEIHIESTHNAKLNSSNQLTASRETEPLVQRQPQETSIIEEEGLRQSPILLPTAPDFWEEANGEA